MIFDQYSRYRATSIAIDYIVKNSNFLDQVTVSDIGSGPYKLLGNFLPTANISYVDPLLENQTSSNPNEKLIAKSIFDSEDDLSDLKSQIVVSVDTLEHIEPDMRSEFLERLFKISEHSIILSFPCRDTIESSDVDNFVNNFFKSTFGEDYCWLKEHFEYGLPSTKETKDFFIEKGLNVAIFKQGNCNWLKELLPITLALNEFDFLSHNIEEQSEYFNTQVAPFDIGLIGYRSVLVASKNKLDFNDLIPSKLSQELKLNNIISAIKDELFSSSLLPALSKLRLANKKNIELQLKTVEMGEWGLVLQKRLQDLEKAQAVNKKEL